MILHISFFFWPKWNRLCYAHLEEILEELVILRVLELEVLFWKFNNSSSEHLHYLYSIENITLEDK